MGGGGGICEGSTPLMRCPNKHIHTHTRTHTNPHPHPHLLVLELDPDHAEGVAARVVVDVDAAEALLARLDGHPLLTGVVVHHDGGPGLADALLTEGGDTQGGGYRVVLSCCAHQ